MFNKGYKLVANITGGGLGFFDMLTINGGASSLLLEGNIPYNQKSTIQLLGGEPEKYTSEDTAIRLADAAYRRCLELSDNAPKCIGFACTSQLRKHENEREGRENFGYAALRVGNKVHTRYIPAYGSDRFSQEGNLSMQLFKILRDFIEEEDIEHFTNSYDVNTIYAVAEQGRTVLPVEDEYNVLCGSFNPFHEGHDEIAKKAFEINGKETLLEMSIENVDKLPIMSSSSTDRVKSIEEYNSKYIKGYTFTRAPLFVNKFDLFPEDTVYLMGSDTWNRCVQNLEFRIQAQLLPKKKFIIFAREGHEIIKTGNFDAANVIYVDNFRKNISSTQIRLDKSGKRE